MADTSYLKYFGLKEEPFTPLANPRYFYLTPPHGVALEKTRQTIVTGKGMALVYGSTGTGKSSMARLLHGQFIEKGYRSVLLVNPSLPTPFSLLRKIVAEFSKFGDKDELIPAYSFLETMERFNKFLLKYGSNPEKRLVLIIDEAHKLNYPLLELLRQIMNYEPNDKKLLQFVLFGEPGLREAVSHARAASFRRRIRFASVLYPLTTDEVFSLMEFRWYVASGHKKNPFTKNALHSLWEASEGIPSEVAVLADNALLSAFLGKKKVVTSKVVNQVADERDLNLGKQKIQQLHG